MRCGACCAEESTDIQVAPVALQRFEGEVDPDFDKVQPNQEVTGESGAGADIFAPVQQKEQQLEPKATEPAAPEQPTEEEPPVIAQTCGEPLSAIKETNAFIVSLFLTKGKSAGMGLDLSEGSYLRVCKIDARGPVPEHNLKVSLEGRSEGQVKVGDFVVAVNGVKGSARDMMMALHTTGAVELTLRRPYDFTLAGLKKEGEQLGLDLSYHPRSASLVVKQVLPTGAIPKWNASVLPNQQVREDDHIICVNGNSGSPKDLHQCIRDSQTLELVISRPLMD